MANLPQAAIPDDIIPDQISENRTRIDELERQVQELKRLFAVHCSLLDPDLPVPVNILADGSATVTCPSQPASLPFVLNHAPSNSYYIEAQAGTQIVIEFAETIVREINTVIHFYSDGRTYTYSMSVQTGGDHNVPVFENRVRKDVDDFVIPAFRSGIKKIFLSGTNTSNAYLHLIGLKMKIAVSGLLL